MEIEEIRKKAAARYPSIVAGYQNRFCLGQQQAYIDGYLDAKRELGWRKYPEKKPTKEGYYICRFKNSSSVKSLYWYEKYPWVDIDAWMPIPEEGGER